jgi:hypothetical protein
LIVAANLRFAVKIQDIGKAERLAARRYVPKPLMAAISLNLPSTRLG